MKYLWHLSAGLLFTALLSTAVAAKRPEIIELDNIVAIVNRDVITAVELNDRVTHIRNRLLEQKAQLPDAATLRKQILERMVIEAIQVQLADMAGIRVDDEKLNLIISNIAQQNGMQLEQFRQVLEKDGIPFARFREEIRNEVIISQLQKNRVENQVNVSESEVETQLAKLEDRLSLNDEYRLAHILVAIPGAASPAQIEAAKDKANKILTQLRFGADFAQTAISVSDGQQALSGGDLGWVKRGQLPTVFADIIPRSKVGDITEPVRSASGFHIIKILDKRSEEHKHVITQTMARHILIKTSAILNSQEAKEKLSRIYDRIVVGGADFGELAKASSDDTASAVDGGNLKWINPGTMVPEFEAEMQKLNPGEISKPFESRFGWHIVQVISRRQHDDTEEFLRNQAREQIRKRKIAEETENWLRRIRDEAYVEFRLSE